MKFTSVTLLSTVLAGSFPGLEIIDRPGVNGTPYFNTAQVYYGFSKNESLNITYSYTCDLAYRFTYSLIGKNHKTGATVFSQQKIIKIDPSATFTISTANYLFDTGLELEFSVTSVDGKNYHSSTGVIYPSKTNYVDVSRYKSEPLTIDDVCYGITNSVLKTSETYDFRDMNDSFSKTSENAVSLDEIRFSYSEKKFLNYESAYLEITDYNNLYPLVSGNGNIKLIPVSLTNKNGEVSFEVNSQMYVNQSTLDMSSSYLEGYTQTNEFYIPKNKENEFSKNEYKIVVNGFGYSNSQISIPLDFYYSSKLLGMCYDSDYCIHGGILE